jgi:NAD(P) transhydrogenase subunit alpha
MNPSRIRFGLSLVAFAVLSVAVYATADEPPADAADAAPVVETDVDAAAPVEQPAADEPAEPKADDPAEKEEEDGETPDCDANPCDAEVGDKKMSRHAALLASLTIFVLAVFVGFEVITKVPPTLHTPLMSGSNAISGITLVGAILAAGSSNTWVAWLGTIAVVLAAINVVGGFLVTHRMLAMFKRK